MLSEKELTPDVYKVDRPLHHALAMAAYQQSFAFRNLTKRYMKTELKRLQDVFEMVSIADPHLPSIRRSVDTFDLTNPYQAARLREACYRDLPSPSRIKTCLKAIDKYCQFLKACPTVHISGQQSLYLPEIYGPIESPLNRYTIPRYHANKPANRNYLERSEYKQWLRFTWSQIQNNLPVNQLLKASQLHLMCVIAGETGMRLQEILGLQPEHFMLDENICLVLKGKASNGSGYRKRTVPISALLKASLQDFLKQFQRPKGAPLFQNRHGQALGKNTAHHWMKALIEQIKAAGLPILIEPGFGWHAFRRTYTRLYLEQSTDIFQLKRNTGWTYTSTIAHYLCDSKQKAPVNGPPLYIEGVGHGG
jgi:integrase